MMGAPVAGVFGPGTTSRSPPDSFPPPLRADGALSGAVGGGVQVYSHVGVGAGDDGDLPADVLALLQLARIGHRSPGNGERMAPHRSVGDARLGFLAELQLEGERCLPVVRGRLTADTGGQRVGFVLRFTQSRCCGRSRVIRDRLSTEGGRLPAEGVLNEITAFGRGVVHHHRDPGLHRRRQKQQHIGFAHADSEE